MAVQLWTDVGGSTNPTKMETSGRCKMYPDMSFSESTTTETRVLGVATQKAFYEGSEMGVAAENGGCKCNPCTCNPCTCK
ncbi:hypothetical protein RJ639_029315 [Escallonia herrerae]|uniref:Metallothionein-like protein n=1 Tax=Escallonia herrerae TaxID=1293975 RepID=A0AA88XAB0_9ASTE|nr:hypothetical protein RJ639_029315 [Escallonia herrerae]